MSDTDFITQLLLASVPSSVRQQEWFCTSQRPGSSVPETLGGHAGLYISLWRCPQLQWGPTGKRACSILLGVKADRVSVSHSYLIRANAPPLGDPTSLMRNTPCWPSHREAHGSNQSPRSKQWADASWTRSALPPWQNLGKPVLRFLHETPPNIRGASASGHKK